MSEAHFLRDDQRVVVSAAAIKAPVTWEEVKAGKNGIRKIEDTHFANSADFSKVDAQVVGAVDFLPEEDPYISDVLSAHDRKWWHRSHLMAAGSMHDAMESGRLFRGDFDGYRIGALVGSTFSGGDHAAEVDFGRLRPGDAFQYLLARVATASANQADLHNLVAQVGAECASSGTAAVMGAVMLSKYRPDVPALADIMIVGGSDAPISPLNMNLFLGSIKRAGTLTDNPWEASKPLDESADGLVMAEGAGMLVLETWKNAQARGLTEKDIWAEMVGYAAYTDAETNTMAGLEGATRVIDQALKMGRVSLGETVYANLHNTGTPVGTPDKPGGDRRELNAYRQAIARRDLNVGDFWLSATKANTGHTMGAAAAIEAYYSIMALREGIVPPRIKLRDPIEETDGFQLGSDYSQAVHLPQIDVAVTSNFGFTGAAAALAFRKFSA